MSLASSWKFWENPEIYGQISHLIWSRRDQWDRGTCQNFDKLELYVLFYLHFVTMPTLFCEKYWMYARIMIAEKFTDFFYTLISCTRRMEPSVALRPLPGLPPTYRRSTTPAKTPAPSQRWRTPATNPRWPCSTPDKPGSNRRPQLGDNRYGRGFHRFSAARPGNRPNPPFSYKNPEGRSPVYPPFYSSNTNKAIDRYAVRRSGKSGNEMWDWSKINSAAHFSLLRPQQ